MTTLTGATVLVRQLLAEGVEHVFGNPGTTEQAFVREVARTPELTYVLGLQESIAAGAADGYARAAGRPAFLQLHAAAGVGNALGMLYSAQVGRAPMVVYCGEPATTLSELEPILYGRPASMAKEFVKCAVRVDDVAQLATLTRRAFKIAAEAPTGVVMLSVPQNVLDDTVEIDDEAGFFASSRIDVRTVPAAEVVEDLAWRLLTAQRPVLLCGDGVARSGAADAVVALAEQIGAPIFDVSSSELTVPSTTPLFQGGLNMLSDRSITRDLDPFDVLVGLGASFFPLINVSGAALIRSDQQFVQIDPDGWELGKNRPADRLIRADIPGTLRLIGAAIDRVAGPDFGTTAAARTADVVSARQERDKRFVAALEGRGARGAGMTPLELASVLAEVLPPEVILVDESVSMTGTVQQVVPRTIPGSVLRARGGGLGQGMPTAIGAHLGSGGRRVVAVVGDGASMYTVQSLWTAARHGVPVVFVICNNGSYHILKKNMQYYQNGAPAEETLPYDLMPAIDMVALAAGFGVEGEVVDSADALRKSLGAALERPGPSLIDARVSTPE
ncbi:thiamine pyrophosphate-binding protein [Nakamurella alba]|uniref:thiamine pyrophosphate-binding protein n=1 Tax=Nakamurella alba TaxID=2665158 RepID=UPI0018A96D1F|nr:thiamine pyrophosphate-binding protein [Nakamurella alba]